MKIVEALCIPYSGAAPCRFLLDAGLTHRGNSDLYTAGKATLPRGAFLNDVVGRTDETERFARMLENPQVVALLQTITAASTFEALAIVDRDDPRLVSGRLYRDAARLTAPAGEVILLNHGGRDVQFRTDEDVARDVESMDALRTELSRIRFDDAVLRAPIPAQGAVVLRRVLRSAALLLLILFALAVLTWAVA